MTVQKWQSQHMTPLSFRFSCHMQPIMTNRSISIKQYLMACAGMYDGYVCRHACMFFVRASMLGCMAAWMQVSMHGCTDALAQVRMYGVSA